MKIRLQKMMADAGLASRRKSEEWIAAGKVLVNGKRAQIGDKVDPRTDQVLVGGKKVKTQNEHRYILLHKPRGYVTTMDDERGRKCVRELVKIPNTRVYPVGRLDMASEGALILTNDGELANQIMHPKNHIAKTYRVTVRSLVTDDQVTKLCTGVLIDDYQTAPADVRVIEKDNGRSVLEIRLYEGKNRQVRRMCEALGLDVARLKRTAVGAVKLGMLQPGQWRDLDPKEVKNLKSKEKNSRD